MKHGITLALILLLAAGTVSAQVGPQVYIGGTPGTAPRTNFFQSAQRGATDTWSNDSVYIIFGTYFVDSLSTLTIEPGTVVLADSASAGTFVVARGGTLNAVGGAGEPITFMTTDPAGRRERGDWGGVVILGEAPTNKANPQIEGGIIPGSYGGSIPNHSSGSLRYARIEYPGFRFQINNEINGLTMGGVGDGTTVDHVQVSYAFDDSFEWFGGTVDAKYLIALGGTDDEFDTDFGFSGSIQFGFGLRDPGLWDLTGESQGFESDNEDPVGESIPLTSVQASNMTLVGPKRTDGTAYTAAQRYRYGHMNRRNSRFSLFNSVVMGYPGGLSLRDSLTLYAAGADLLKIENVSMQTDTNFTNALGRFRVIEFRPNSDVGTQTAPPNMPNIGALYNWLGATGKNNLGFFANRQPSAIGLTDMSDLNNPNPVPAGGSELLSAGVSFTGLDPAFDTTPTYRGAFPGGVASIENTWAGGWSNFNPQGTLVMYTVWNMVAPTVNLADNSPSSTFPTPLRDPLSTVFRYNEASQGYDPATTLDAGTGYWVKYTRPTAVKMIGTPITGPIDVVVTNATGGWVLVGSYGRGLDNITVVSGSGTLDPFASQFVWAPESQSYVSVDLASGGSGDVLGGGRGVWVKVTGPCTLRLNELP